MKAKQYYEFYLASLRTKGEEQALYDLLVRMSQECKAMCFDRNVKTNSGAMAVIKEMNDRWNAMRKWDKNFVRDGFLHFWQKRIDIAREQKIEELKAQLSAALGCPQERSKNDGHNNNDQQA